MAEPIYDDKKETTSDGKGQSLGDQEKAAGQNVSGADAKDVSSSDLNDAESESGGLYDPRKDPISLIKRVKNISARRKAFGALGFGGIVGIALTLFTLFPSLRLPSIMGSVLSLTGHAVEEVAENRAHRFVISYAIRRAEVDAVAGNSLWSTVFRTMRAKNVEGKILRETGFEWRKVGGEVRMYYYEEGNRTGKPDPSKGRDLGRVRTYEDVIRITDSDPKVQKKFKKVLRIASGKRWLYSSRVANDALKRRFPGLRYDAPEDDKAKTKEQNLADFHTREFDVVDREQRNIFSRALSCILSNECEFFKKKGDPAQSPSREPVRREDQVQDFAKDLDEASNEARDQVQTITEREGEKAIEHELTKVAEEKLLTKITSLGAEGPLALISIAATAVVIAYNAQENDLAQRIPAMAIAYTTGAQATFFSAQADNIEAGRTPLYFVQDMNTQIQGAEKAQTYNLMYNHDGTKGVPVDTRVNNDTTTPMRETTNAVFTAQYYTIFQPLVLFYEAESRIGDLVSLFTGPLFNAVLSAIFGANYEEKLYKWLLDLAMPLFAGNVDAFATGAKWMNQIFVGWSANMNWYCETFMGCKATSAMKESLKPRLPGEAMVPSTQSLQDDVASLPLKDRLFSMDEPSSLINQAVRAAPTSFDPAGMISSVFRQIGSLPSTLLSALSPKARAAGTSSPITPQQIADVTGVRQYGYEASDLAHDISPEILTQADPVCPDNIDQEHQVNLCMADREVAKALVCANADCPEYNSGFNGDGSNHALATLWLNAQQLWKSSQEMRALIW